MQDENRASYEGWCRAAEARIYWHHHADFIYNLIRGCNPALGAWTTLAGKKIQLFDLRKHLSRTFSAVKDKPGEVAKIGHNSISITAQGGRIEVFMLKAEDGKKMSAIEFANETGLNVGALLGS